METEQNYGMTSKITKIAFLVRFRGIKIVASEGQAEANEA
jgi:hypothetical protein